MFKKVNKKSVLLFGCLAGMLFCIPVFFFIKMAMYTQSWLFYVGSSLFLIAIALYTIVENKKRGENESTVSLIFAAHITTLAGIIIACIICFILLATFVPGYLNAGNADKALSGQPANTILDKTNGLSFEVFMCATILNFVSGSFAAIIIPFAQKRNQTKDSREPSPLEK